MAYLRGRFETPEAIAARIERSGENPNATGDRENPPTFLAQFNLKSPDIDELLPLLIILAHRRAEVKAFYDRIMTFCVNIAKAGRTSWVGSWMGFKLMNKVMERFGLLELGGSASYDAGLSWAFGVTAATEVFSDIQIGDIVENILEKPSPIILKKGERLAE